MASILDTLAPVAPLLPGFAAGAAQDLDLVCTKIPGVSVSSQAYRGTIFVENSNNYMGGRTNLKTAISAPYIQQDLALPTNVTYECSRYQTASNLIPAQLMARSQLPITLPARQASAIGRRIALAFEADVATVFQDTSTWSNSSVAALGGSGVQWSTWSTATPDTDISIACVEARKLAYGRDPDTLIISIQCLDQYIRCLQAQNVALVTQGAAAGPSVQILQRSAAIERIKSINSLKNVIVGRVRRVTSAPGQTVTTDYVWGKSFWVGCLDNGEAVSLGGGDVMVNPVAALVLREPSAMTPDGAMLMGGVMDAAFPISIIMQQTSFPTAIGVMLGGDLFSTIKVTDANLGYLVTSVVA